MAGTLNTGYRNNTRFYLKWSVDKQDIANNRSLIKWTIGVHANAIAYWYSNAIRINSAYVNGGSSIASGTWSNISLSGGQNKALKSGSKWVSHNSNGAKSIKISISGWFYGYGDISASNIWALPTIPRNSQVTTDKSSYTLGSAIKITTNRKSSAFTHTIRIRKDNNSGTLIKTINSVGASVTWTPTGGEITTLQNLIPNTNKLKLYIRQDNHQVDQSSSVTVTLNLTNANPTFSNFTYKDSNSSVVAITGDDQVLVQGRSILETTISSANKMVAIKGASPVRYSIAYDGVTKQENYQASSDIVDTFNAVSTGQRTILVTAVDSRTNNTSASKLVTVYPYSTPTIETTLTRENNFGTDTTIHVEGAWTPLVIGSVQKNDLTTGSLEYRYAEDGDAFSGWTSKTFTQDNSGTWTLTTDFVLSLANTKKYNFEFRISDKFGTVTKTASVDIGQPAIFMGRYQGEPTIGIGKMPETPGLDVAGDIYVDNSRVVKYSDTINFHSTIPSDQDTGTGGGTVRINFVLTDIMGASAANVWENYSFKVPADGWLRMSCSLSLIGGSGSDDSMHWGVYRDSGSPILVADNWKYHAAGSGIDYVSSMSAGLPVVKDELIRIGFSGVQSQSITIMGNYSHFEGTFTAAETQP